MSPSEVNFPQLRWARVMAEPPPPAKARLQNVRLQDILNERKGEVPV